MQFIQQVGAFNLEGPVHLERLTTPQASLLSEQEQQELLPLLPTPPLHPSQEHLEVDSTLQMPQHSLLGMLYFTLFMLPRTFVTSTYDISVLLRTCHVRCVTCTYDRFIAWSSVWYISISTTSTFFCTF